MKRSEPQFADAQRLHFEDADVEQYRWTTSAPGIAESEDALLAPLLLDLESPCLEVGCGEGNTLARLAREQRCVGVDLFPRKLIFAASELPQVLFPAADAARLPFADASFASVFVRDLLHHVPQPLEVVAELVRVLRPGGRICLLEPNGLNPRIRLQTQLVPAAVGARESGFAYIESLLREQPLEAVRLVADQPLALRRLLLHYKMGLPALGRPAPLRRALAGLERALGWLLPRSMWTYVVATARRSE